MHSIRTPPPQPRDGRGEVISARRPEIVASAGNVVRLSIIIPTYGRAVWLPRTLRSVFQQLPEDAEVVVVEQNIPSLFDSADWTAELATGQLQHFVVTPPSLPAARNFGVSRARGEVLIFIDDDVELAAGFIEAHWNALHRDPPPGAVVGREVNFRTDQRGPAPLLAFRGGMFVDGAFDAVVSQPATALIGCNMSFRRSVLLSVGGFDPSYIRNALREESDVACRLLRAGESLWFEAQAELRHHVAPEGGCRDLALHSTAAYYHNEFLFHLRHAPLRRVVTVIGSEFGRWVWPQKGNLISFVKRLVAWGRGILSALWRFVFPRRLNLSLIGPEGYASSS